MLYQFVTGENPFSGRTMATIMHKVLNAEPVDPADLNLHISPDLNAVIKKAIAKKPENRFQNAKEFFIAINRALQNGSSEMPSSPVIETDSNPEATSIPSSQQKSVSPHEKIDTLNSSASPAESEKKSVSGFENKAKWLGAGIFFVLLTVAGMYFLFSDKEISYGYVNIFTKPYAEIFINGKSYGKTPKAKLKLHAGSVDIRFVNKSKNINITETVIIEPDKTIRRSFIWKR